jgi:hypothetical protein
MDIHHFCIYHIILSYAANRFLSNQPNKNLSHSTTYVDLVNISRVGASSMLETKGSTSPKRAGYVSFFFFFFFFCLKSNHNSVNVSSSMISLYPQLFARISGGVIHLMIETGLSRCQLSIHIWRPQSSVSSAGLKAGHDRCGGIHQYSKDMHLFHSHV